jgi:hypothetical protein
MLSHGHHSVGRPHAVVTRFIAKLWRRAVSGSTVGVVAELGQPRMVQYLKACVGVQNARVAQRALERQRRAIG